jgi:hypothetical protein
LPTNKTRSGLALLIGLMLSVLAKDTDAPSEHPNTSQSTKHFNEFFIA